MDDKLERYEEALRRIAEWADAYPLKVFPEPDIAKAQRALDVVGMTVDAISASAIRFAIKGVSKIAKEALEG